LTGLDETSKTEHAELMIKLGIEKEDLIVESYSDLMLKLDK